MKLNLIIECNSSEKDKIFSECELLAFLNKSLIIDQIDDINILSAGIIDALTIEECDLPDKLIKRLHENGIYYLYEMQRFRYFQIYDILGKDFFNGKYKEVLYHAMKKYEINFFDINIDSLIPIKDCGLSARTVSRLTRAGYIYLQDMAHSTRNKVFATRNFGEKSKKELEEKMIEYGIWYLE